MSRAIRRTVGVAGCCGLIAWLVALAEPPRIDPEVITQAFQRIENALVDGDRASIEHILARTPKKPTREETASAIVGLLSEMKQAGVGLEGLEGTPHACLYHLMKASLVRYEETERRFDLPAFTLWLKEPGGRTGQIVLVEQNGELLLLFEALVSTSIRSWTSNAYDYSSPTNAFCSLLQAQSIRDVFAIHGSISQHILRGAHFEMYRDFINEKRRAGATLPYGVSACHRVEEEMLPQEDGEQRSRVWRLDQSGKRTTFELFVKEGDEWKWVLDEKSIWYPANPDQKTGE